MTPRVRLCVCEVGGRGGGTRVARGELIHTMRQCTTSRSRRREDSGRRGRRRATGRVVHVAVSHSGVCNAYGATLSLACFRSRVCSLTSTSPLFLHTHTHINTQPHTNTYEKEMTRRRALNAFIHLPACPHLCPWVLHACVCVYARLRSSGGHKSAASRPRAWRPNQVRVKSEHRAAWRHQA